MTSNSMDRIGDLIHQVELPVGLFEKDGRCHSEAVLRPLCGADEEWLASLDPGQSAISAAAHLLRRCLIRIGPYEPVPVEKVRKLLVVDKDYLLLQLLKVSFGTQVQAVVTCPATECGEKMDIDFNIDDIQPEGNRPDKPMISFRLPANSANEKLEVALRLPTLADMERLTMERNFRMRKKVHGDGNHTTAKKRLLSYCLIYVGDQKALDKDLLSILDKKALHAIEKKFAESIPRFDLDLEHRCLSCGHVFMTRFDPLAFLIQKLRIAPQALYREVHTLAFWYHWPEDTILCLDRRKRRMYLNFIQEQLNATVEA